MVCIECKKKFKVERGNRKRCPKCISKKVNPNKAVPNVKCPMCEKIHYSKGASMKNRIYCDGCKNTVETVFNNGMIGA